MVGPRTDSVKFEHATCDFGPQCASTAPHAAPGHCRASLPTRRALAGGGSCAPELCEEAPGCGGESGLMVERFISAPEGVGKPMVAQQPDDGAARGDDDTALEEAHEERWLETWRFNGCRGRGAMGSNRCLRVQPVPPRPARGGAPCQGPDGSLSCLPGFREDTIVGSRWLQGDRLLRRRSDRGPLPPAANPPGPRVPTGAHPACNSEAGHAECLQGLEGPSIPPGNRLELLKGDLTGFHSMRINDRWLLGFRWGLCEAREVQILDYHRG